MNLSNIPAVLASTESVAAALETAKAKDAALKSKIVELDQFLNPDAHIEALKEIIREQTHFEVVQAAQRQIAEISAQKDTVREKAQGIVRQMHNDLSGSLRDLLSVALQETENLTAQAREAEKAFYSGFSIAGESTAVVKHIQDHAAQLRRMLEGFEQRFTKPLPSVGTVAPDSGAHVFAWFGQL